MIRDAIKALILAHALPVVGVLFSVLVVIYGAYEWRLSAAYHNGYHVGGQVVRDSVKVATAKQFHADEQVHKQKANSLIAVADSIHASRPQPVASQIERIEPITASDSQLVPTAPLSQFTRVYVRNTGRAYLVETPAAAIWYATDTLLSRHYIPENLKLKAEVVTLRSALTERMLAVSDADSSAHYWQSLYEERPAPQAPPHPNMHRIAYLALGIAAGFIAAKRLH